AKPIVTLELSRPLIPNSNRNRRHGTAPDPRATIVSADGKPLLASFAAHATALGPENLTYSGDWPGIFSLLTRVAFFPSAIGDASPVTSHVGEPGATDIALALAGSLKSVPSTIIGPGELRLITEPIQLAKPTPHPGFAKEYKVPDALAQVLVDKFAPTEGEVSVLSLGHFAIIGVSGEPTGDVGRRIQDAARKAGYWDSLVMSHCNGWIGYVLEPKDYDKGGYEANLAFHGREAADRVVEAAARALARATGV
ncbi:MAG: hypothetical protein ABUL72_00535, partial [Armatimonadota bacterium]